MTSNQLQPIIDEVKFLKEQNRKKDEAIKKDIDEIIKLRKNNEYLKQTLKLIQSRDLADIARTEAKKDQEAQLLHLGEIVAQTPPDTFLVGRILKIAREALRATQDPSEVQE